MFIFIVEMCLEKRVFYRMMSGLHASINIHLSAIYLFKGKSYQSVPFVASNERYDFFNVAWTSWDFKTSLTYV